MTKVIIVLLIAINMLADIGYKNSGTLDYSLSHMDNKYINTLDLVVNNDISFDSSKLVISPGVFVNDRSTYNSIVKGDVARVNELYLNELYYSYFFGDSGLSLSVGLFPFRKGAFYEYGFNGYRAGNGLYSITDIVLQGAILSYNIDDSNTIQIGSVAFEKFFTSYRDSEKTSGPVTFDSFKNSAMDYIAYKYNDKSIYVDLELSKVYQYINNADIIDSNVVSLGLSYNDEIETGRTYYSILSTSHSKGDTSSLYPTMGMYTGTPPPPGPPGGPSPRYTDNHFYYDKFETHGYYYLLGIKQEIDRVLFERDLVLSAEYGYRSPGYHNLLAGRPISPHSYADIGHFYNFSVGVRIAKNNMVKLRYLIYDTDDKSTKYGFSPITTESSNVPGSKDHYSVVVLHWYLDF